jgi:hypothetical protein
MSMKIKNIIMALVSVFVLSSCSPPLIVPLETLGYSWPGGEGFSTGWAYQRDFPNKFECYTGSDCLLVHYNSKIHRLDWSFIGWYSFDCGRRTAERAGCVTDLLKSGNFREIQRLTFWARGENGNEIVEFGVGGGFEIVQGSFGFEYLKPQRQPTGRVILTSHWEKYEIDLVDRDLTHVVPLFYAYYTVEDNPQGAKFYVDDIQFEGH